MKTLQNPFLTEINRKRKTSLRRFQAQGASRFDGAAPLPSVISTGTRDPFNDQANLHKQMVSLSITNTDANNHANLVLMAGRHAGDAGLITTAQVISDGAGTYPNDKATPDDVPVTVAADYGTDTANNWGAFQELVKEYGVLISGGRISYETQAQATNKLRVITYDPFGDSKTDFISPQVYYDPHQFHDKVAQFGESLILNRDKILKYRLEANETVTIDLFVDSVLNIDHILAAAAAQKGDDTFALASYSY